jgi:hypothetical protein
MGPSQGLGRWKHGHAGAAIEVVFLATMTPGFAVLMLRAVHRVLSVFLFASTED